MAGFGMILGGAMSGWSDARLDEIKAEREARLQELEAQRQDRRLADEREFRSREAALGREHDTAMADRSEKFQSKENEINRAATRENREDTQKYQSGENQEERSFRREEREGGQDFESTEREKDRDYRSTEADKQREAAGDLVTDDKGNSYSRTGSKVKPITGDDGKPVKLATTGSAASKPAEVSTAEWLVTQGVAPDAATAWKMVRSARSDPDKSRASIYKAWLDALTKGQLGTPDPAELEKQAREATEKTLQYLGDEDSAGGGAAPAQDSGASSVIPSDPAKRVIGKTYTNKDGKKAIWRGNGWEPVQ